MARRELVSCLLALGTSLALSAGCDPVEQDAAGDEGDDAVVLRPGGSGVWLNTSAIGSHAFAALDLKKGKHDGVRLDRVLIKQGPTKFVTLDRVTAVDGEIQAGIGGSTYFGQQLVGSKWELTLVNGAVETPATMWISSATMIGGGLWRYNFQHHDASGVVANLCDPDADGSTFAVPIPDMTVNTTTGDLTARANTLYLACLSGGIGKAVQWGFQPWDIGLAELEATVRVVRADYCGDGVSWTVPGTQLQLDDIWGVSNFGSAAAATEAVWGANRALCLGATRIANQPPTCNGFTLPTCASNASLTNTSGAMLWSKLAPQ